MSIRTYLYLHTCNFDHTMPCSTSTTPVSCMKLSTYHMHSCNVWRNRSKASELNIGIKSVECTYIATYSEECSVFTV